MENSAMHIYIQNEYVCFSVSRPALQCIYRSLQILAFSYVIPFCVGVLTDLSSLFHLLSFPLFRNEENRIEKPEFKLMWRMNFLETCYFKFLFSICFSNRYLPVYIFPYCICDIDSINHDFVTKF